jgi:aspartyl-tRNA(Asn)/glutamyl-tRNA(Gln) amidotransferase subunit A
MDLAACSATQLLELYRHGLASPVDATKAVLQRIEQHNEALVAFRMVDPDLALESARASERRWRDHAPLGLLDGVPVSIKDLILTRGWATLRGSMTVDPVQPWDIDAPSTARLRESGAVLLGKTTTPEFGCKGVTDSYLTGISRNPWNLRHSPGGSSGGAAAAVAARMGPLALGTDGAGSIRIPSAFCGVAGMKASFGRVPAWPSSVFGTLAHVGPHARTIEDLALALTVLARPDTRDWTSLPPEGADYRIGIHDGVVGLRIAFSPTLGYAQVDSEIAAATRQCAQHLYALGAHVDEVDPGFEDPLDLICGLWFLGSATLLSGLTCDQALRMDPFLRWQAEQGARLTGLEVNRLHQRRADLGVRMRQFHERYDMLLSPAVAVQAPLARETGSETSFDAALFLGWTPFSYPFNLTMQPACVLPCGLSRAGLPMSVQLVGPMHADRLVLRTARALESTLPGLPEPPLS